MLLVVRDLYRIVMHYQPPNSLGGGAEPGQLNVRIHSLGGEAQHPILVGVLVGDEPQRTKRAKCVRFRHAQA